jgi:stress response protein YsnF
VSKEIVEEAVLPIVEEQLRVGKVLRAGRTVTVRTRVVQDEAVVAEDLLRETVTVRRVPIGRPVDAAEAPRQEGDTLVIPVYREELVVTKQLVLEEEIHLSQTTSTEHVSQTVPLARTLVEITETEA